MTHVCTPPPDGRLGHRSRDGTDEFLVWQRQQQADPLRGSARQLRDARPHESDQGGAPQTTVTSAHAASLQAADTR